jgi:hypothetical protein
MTCDVDPLREERDLLAAFALAVIVWIEDPRHGLRRDALIYQSRLVGPHTGIPDVFEDFAHRVEQHRSHRGSETR